MFGKAHHLFGGFLLLRRDWEDFVALAYDLFGDDADNLERYMWENRLTKQQVLYYCNWTLGMTQQQLADEFETTQQAVAQCLKRLKEKWPELFLFTLPHPMFQYRPSRHDTRIVWIF